MSQFKLKPTCNERVGGTAHLHPDSKPRLDKCFLEEAKEDQKLHSNRKMITGNYFLVLSSR